jgi:hypothetical protein
VLQSRLLDIVAMSAAHPITFEDSCVVRFTLDLWLGCLLDKPQLRAAFIRLANLEDFAMKLVLCHGDSAARIRADFRCGCVGVLFVRTVLRRTGTAVLLVSQSRPPAALPRGCCCP